MNLAHYSAKPITALRPYPRETWGGRDRRPVGDKPLGLWLSDDACSPNWKSWCEGEEWGLDGLKHRHAVTLSSTSNVLILSGTDAILAFHHRFQAPISNTMPDYLMIDWGRVCAEWQGIIITPYVWELRLDRRCRWYYGWDCASGCIWDIDAIESLMETIT